MGGNHTGMIMATKKKQPRKRGGNKTRAPERMETWSAAEDAAGPAITPRLVEAFIGALGAAFATRAYRHLTERRRLVVFVSHAGMHSGAPVLHVTDELERTEDGRVLARPSCSPEHVGPAVKAWPVTRLKETHDALAAGAHWCRRCEELAQVQIAEFATRRAESFAAGGGIIGPIVKHEPPAEPKPADRRVSQSCKNCSFVGAVDGEPACNLSRHYVPFDPGAEIAPFWCRLRQGPVLVTLGEKK